MSGPSPSPSPPLQVCPFCGVATEITHENQESCIAALNHEIARVRGILAHLRPAGVPQPHADAEEPAETPRLSLD